MEPTASDPSVQQQFGMIAGMRPHDVDTYLHRSRVAKIEAGDPSVSLDLIVRALFATGATRQELQRAFSPKE
jgi:hypothetical protein